MELLRKNIPVGAELKPSAQCCEYRKGAVPVDAPFELRSLGPGVGIEQPMAVQRDAGFHKAKPKRLGFCAK